MIDINLSLTDKQFKLVQKMIYEQAGIDLPDSKLSMVQGRLAKRLRALRLDSYDKYFKFLEKDPTGPELVEFINSLTTNKTHFFRENHHFEYLKQQILPELKSALEFGSRKLRIWSAACSTGEEPYSIAMILRETLRSSCDMAILASDIDTQVLQQCNQGIYGEERAEEIPKHLLHRYFDKIKPSGFDTETRWRAKEMLRELIRFRRINFQDNDWPIQTKFDVIFCRNVMIYFDVPTQQRLIERFAQYLKPDGHLIIGHSETLSGISDRFELAGNTIYRIKGEAGTHTAGRWKSSATATNDSSPASSANPSANNSPGDTSGTSPSCQNDGRSARSTGTLESPRRTSLPRLKLPDATVATPYRLARTNESVHPIIVGEIHASYEPKWVSTLLGSCVSACLFDERVCVGGMNHFMLPLGGVDKTTCASYGVHAMEMLINSLMKLGADRRRLKAKLFGGGAVIRTSDSRWNVGLSNIEFAKQFLHAEGIPLVASHTGGESAMHVRFHTRTHKALVRLLDDKAAAQVVEAENKAPTSIDPVANSVTLF